MLEKPAWSDHRGIAQKSDHLWQLKAGPNGGLTLNHIHKPRPMNQC